MITIGDKKFFSEEDFEVRQELVQRAINLLTDPNKYEKFSREMFLFLEKFENKNGLNTKVIINGSATV